MFVEPLPEGEVSTTQLVLTQLLPSNHLTTDVIFWTYSISEDRGREGERVLVNTNLCRMNTLRLTSSKQFSPKVVEILRRKASLGVCVEEAVQSFRDTRPWDTVWYHKRLSILLVHVQCVSCFI